MRKAYRQELPLLRFILSSGASTAQIKALLPTLSRNQLNVIAEIAFNVLQGVIPLSQTGKESLRHFVKQIRSIGQKKKKCAHIRESLTAGGMIALLKVSMPYVEQMLTEHESHR